MPSSKKPKVKDVSDATDALDAAITKLRKGPPDDWGGGITMHGLVAKLGKHGSGQTYARMKDRIESAGVRSGKFVIGGNLRTLFSIKDLAIAVDSGSIY